MSEHSVPPSQLLGNLRGGSFRNRPVPEAGGPAGPSTAHGDGPFADADVVLLRRHLAAKRRTRRARSVL